MTESCPSVFELAESESSHEAHLASCQSCSALLGLRQGGCEELSESCEEIEFLLAVFLQEDSEAQRLRARDERTLLRHLSGCSRCLEVATTSLLDVSEASSDRVDDPLAWTHAGDSEKRESGRLYGRRQLVWGGGFVAIAAAAALFFFARATPTREDSVSQPFAMEKELNAHPPAAIPPVEKTVAAPLENTAVDKEALVDEDSKTSVSRPKAAENGPKKSVRVLLAEGRKAFQAKDYQETQRLCEATLAKEPGNQQARVLCGFAACYLGDVTVAKRHVSKLNPVRRSGLRRLCERQGLDLGLLGPPPPEAKVEVCKEQLNLNRSDLSAAMTRIRPKVMACGEEHPVGQDSRVLKVFFAVEPSGRIGEASMRGSTATPKDELARCVLRAAKEATFKKTCEGRRFTYPFVFRSELDALLKKELER